MEPITGVNKISKQRWKLVRLSSSSVSFFMQLNLFGIEMQCL